MRKTLALLTVLMVATAALAQEPNAGKQLGKMKAPVPSVRPTSPDVKYGPYARNVMDVWLAKSDKPTPVLVSIHGGGFSGGNKSVGPWLADGMPQVGHLGRGDHLPAFR